MVVSYSGPPSICWKCCSQHCDHRRSGGCWFTSAIGNHVLMVSDLRPPRTVVSDLQPPRMVFVDLRPPFHAGCNYATDIIGGRKCASTMWRWSQICDHQKQSVVIVRAPIYLSHGGLMFKTSIFVVVSNTRPPFLAPMVVAHRRPHHECRSNYTVPGISTLKIGLHLWTPTTVCKQGCRRL
jgi:hypothetical protein